MDLKSIKAGGANLTAAQQTAFYYARQRRRERQNAGASEFKSKDHLGIIVVVIVTTE